MSEMIERVAAVIAAEIMELTADQRASFKFPDDANGDTCDRARSAARLAIKAMREPTQQMRLAGIAEWSRPDPTSDHESTLVFNAIWRTMIDEALK